MTEAGGQARHVSGEGGGIGRRRIESVAVQMVQLPQRCARSDAHRSQPPHKAWERPTHERLVWGCGGGDGSGIGVERVGVYRGVRGG